MGLGTALLQPQITARTAPDGMAALVEDVQRLVAVLLNDAADDGPLAGVVEAAFLATGPMLQAQVEPRLEAAQRRMAAWIRGPRGLVDELAREVERVGSDPTAVLEVVRWLLQRLRGMAATLTLPGIRAQLQVVQGLVVDDLGLSPAKQLDLLRAFLDDLATRLATVLPGEDADVRRRRRLAASVVASLRMTLDDVVLPDFDIEAMARAIHSAIEEGGLAGPLAQIDCALEALEAGVTAAAAAGAAARPAARPVGAGVVPISGASLYYWYPSWLLNQHDIPLFGLSDIKEKAGLIAQFRRPQTDIDRHVRERWFSDAERAELDRDDPGSPDPATREKLLLVLGVLNRAMQAGPVLDELPRGGLIAEDLLTDEIRALRTNLVADQTLLEYNRRVLERAYAQLFDGYSSKHTRRFVKHVLLPIFGDVGTVKHQVTVTGDRRFVMCDDKPIHIGTDVHWHHAPIFQRVPNGLWFSFRDDLGAQKCEIIAQVLLTAAAFVKPVVHVAKVQPGHAWQGGLYSGLEFGELLQQVLFGKPLSAHFQLKGSTAHGAGVWLDSAAGWRGLSVLMTSLEGTVGRNDVNQASFWLTTFLGDAIRTVKPLGWIDMGPNVLLSLITLINSRRVPFDGPHSLPSNPSANHKVQKGITKSIDKLFELLLHSAYPRDSYSIFLWNEAGIGDRRLEAMLGHWFGVSAGVAVLSGLTGTVVVQTIAWVEEWDRLGLTIKDSFLRYFFQYWITNYLKNENNTDGGRYRPGGGGSYRGYPEKTSANPSPYRLPMPAGVALCVGQANQGLFSHNFIANSDFVTPANSAPLQTYAYDFSHQFREPIACVRDGVIVGGVQNTIDTNPDTTSAGDATPQNMLTIRHSTIDPVHDVLDGAPVQTYSVYIHLANNGIRNAPLFGGTMPPAGTAVTRGQLIALAGDTGMSFHNHLHLHVVADDGLGNPGNRSVPFVFDDVDSDGGVPKSISWYRSGNA
jgi:hypothetical protein